MESQRFAAKVFARESAPVPESDVVLFFHRVIQDRLVADTCIDVTDYSHVPGGPGVMLICHEAHYSLDRSGDRLGLRCAMKRGATGSVEDRIQAVLGRLLRLAALVEGHEIFGGRVRFETGSALVAVEDRLLAPPTQETFDAFAPVLAGVATRVWGVSPVLMRAGSPKEPFQVELTASVAPPVGELLARL